MKGHGAVLMRRRIIIDLDRVYDAALAELTRYSAETNSPAEFARILLEFAIDRELQRISVARGVVHLRWS